MEVKTNDGYFQYLALLREELIALQDSIEDACEYIEFDKTKSNWQIANDLQGVIDKYLPNAASFGLYVIEQHKNYQIPEGIELTPDLKKIASTCSLYDAYGLDIKLNDERFIWPGKDYSWGLADYDCKNCKFPLKHSVIKEFIFEKDFDISMCETLSGIFDLIERAKSRSSERSPRSGIREQLLLAILKLNNEILPFDLEEYIKNQRKSW